MFTLIPTPNKWVNAIKITVDSFQKEKGYADVRVDMGGGDSQMRLSFNGITWVMNLRGRKLHITDFHGADGWAITNNLSGDFMQFLENPAVAKAYAVLAKNEVNTEVFRGFLHLPRSYYDALYHGDAPDTITFSAPTTDKFLIVSQLEKEVVEGVNKYLFSFRNGYATDVVETEGGDIILPWDGKQLVLHFNDTVQAHLDSPLLLPLAVVIEIGLVHPDGDQYACEVYMPEEWDAKYGQGAQVFKNPVYAVVDYRSSVVEYADAPEDFYAGLRLENGKQLEINRDDTGTYTLFDGAKTWEVEYFNEEPHLADERNFTNVIADREGAKTNAHLNLVTISEAFDEKDFTAKTRQGLVLIFRTDEQKFLLTNYQDYHGSYQAKVEEAQVTPFGWSPS